MLRTASKRVDPDAETVSFAGTRASGFTKTVRHLLLIGATLVMLYPVIWMLLSSLKPQEDIFDTGFWPQTWTLENYVNGWNALQYGFGRFFANSAFVAAAAVIGNLASCSLAAFAIARLRFRGRKAVLGVVLLTIMLPYHVVVVPQYVVFSSIGWVNTFWPLILPKFLATDAFFVFLMVQFIRGIPKELDEAARIDGAGHLRIFGQVMIPLMVPALATTAIFTFIWTWSDFFTSLIYLTSPDMYTVPIALRSFLDATSGSNWGAMFAMSIVSLVPIFFAFLFGQKYLVKGIATTGGK